jgi:hypothetical protein
LHGENNAGAKHEKQVERIAQVGEGQPPVLNPAGDEYGEQQDISRGGGAFCNIKHPLFRLPAPI